MTDPRDEARRRADWQANQCATQHLQPCTAHHCLLARDVLAGLEREQKWEGLLINSRELREKAEARVAELEAFKIRHENGLDLLEQGKIIKSLRERISDLEEALRKPQEIVWKFATAYGKYGSGHAGICNWHTIGPPSTYCNCGLNDALHYLSTHPEIAPKKPEEPKPAPKVCKCPMSGRPHIHDEEHGIIDEPAPPRAKEEK